MSENAIKKEECLTNTITMEFGGSKEIYPNMKAEKLFEKWLKYKKEYVTPSTHANFALIIQNHIKPYFSGYRINEINEGMIQDFVNHLHSNGRLDGSGGFALNTIRDIMLPLHMAFDYAAKYRAIDKIEWDAIEYPKERKSDKVRAMTYEEQKNFVQACYLNLNAHSAAYLIALFTGLRIGEVCGLQMKDISLEQKTISVNKTVQRIYDPLKKKSYVHIGQPKTESSCRIIPFPSKLVPVIKKFYEDKKPEHYFITAKNKPLDSRTLRQDFMRFLKRHNLPKIKFHELRHTFASRAIETPDFDIKSLSAILGHKSPAFTLNMYGRANLEQEEKCINLLNELL